MVRKVRRQQAYSSDEDDPEIALAIAESLRPPADVDEDAKLALRIAIEEAEQDQAFAPFDDDDGATRKAPPLSLQQDEDIFGRQYVDDEDIFGRQYERKAQPLSVQQANQGGGRNQKKTTPIPYEDDDEETAYKLAIQMSLLQSEDIDVPPEQPEPQAERKALPLSLAREQRLNAFAKRDGTNKKKKATPKSTPHDDEPPPFFDDQKSRLQDNDGTPQPPQPPQARPRRSGRGGLLERDERMWNRLVEVHGQRIPILPNFYGYMNLHIRKQDMDELHLAPTDTVNTVRALLDSPLEDGTLYHIRDFRLTEGILNDWIRKLDQIGATWIRRLRMVDVKLPGAPNGLIRGVVNTVFGQQAPEARIPFPQNYNTLSVIEYINCNVQDVRAEVQWVQQAGVVPSKDNRPLITINIKQAQALMTNDLPPPGYQVKVTQLAPDNLHVESLRIYHRVGRTITRTQPFGLPNRGNTCWLNTITGFMLNSEYLRPLLDRVFQPVFTSPLGFCRYIEMNPVQINYHIERYSEALFSVRGDSEFAGWRRINEQYEPLSYIGCLAQRYFFFSEMFRHHWKLKVDPGGFKGELLQLPVFDLPQILLPILEDATPERGREYAYGELEVIHDRNAATLVPYQTYTTKSLEKGRQRSRDEYERQIDVELFEPITIGDLFHHRMEYFVPQSRYLCIDITRVYGTLRNLYKVNRPVVPEEELRIGNCTFQLKMVGCHSGTTTGGHWWRYELFAGQWWNVSDSSVSAIRFEDIDAEHASIYIFELVTTL